jgi:hypothetical protein
MMLTILAEAALRAFVLGGAVWLGLYLFRVRNPNVHMTAWTLVLVASLMMPLLMHWTTVTVTVQAPPALPAGSFGAEESALPEVFGAPLPPALQGPVAIAHGHGVAVNWPMIATVIYALVAGLLLTRLLLGLHLSWRIARTARPLRADWTAGRDVRVSAAISGPVTVGSTILVPRDHSGWDATKR